MRARGSGSEFLPKVSGDELLVRPVAPLPHDDDAPAGTPVVPPAEPAPLVPLQSVWEHRRCVVVFLRHLGCPLCMRTAAAVARILPALTDNDVSLVAVSLGSQAEGLAWIKSQGWPVDKGAAMYLDESSERVVKRASALVTARGTTSRPISASSSVPDGVSPLYAAFRLNRAAPGALVTEKGTAAFAAAMSDGHTEWTGIPRPGDPAKDSSDGTSPVYPGDVFQLGGVFVFGPGNQCDYAFRSAYAGDDPDLAQLLAAATGRDVHGLDTTYPASMAWARRLNTSGEGSDVQLSFALHNCDEVDAVVLARGAIRCDCRPVVASIPVVGVRDPAAAAAAGAGDDDDGDGGRGGDGDRGHTTFNFENTYVGPRKQAAAASGAAATGTREQVADAVVASDPAIVSQLEIYDRVLCYVREFLGKSHPLVGRPGPVCPFVPLSLRKGTLHMAIVRTAHLTHPAAGGQAGPEGVAAAKRAIRTLVKGLIPTFEALEPKVGKLVAYKAVILVFPDVADAEGPELIDAVQLACKVDFVRRGLMLGEFHRYNNSPGLRNADFYPLRTPYPCLAIRHMVPTDLAFLKPTRYPAALRTEFLESFLRNFGDERDGNHMGAGEGVGSAKRDKKAEAQVAAAREALEDARKERREAQQAARQAAAASAAASEARLAEALRATSPPRGGGAGASVAGGTTGAAAPAAGAGPGSAGGAVTSDVGDPEDADAFRRQAHALIEWIIRYRRGCSEQPVRSQVKPGYLRALVPAQAPDAPESWDTIMADMDRVILPGITHWSSRRFFAYFKPHASYASVLGELATAGLNVMGFSWIASPACTELETAVMDWAAQMFGLPAAFMAGVDVAMPDGSSVGAGRGEVAPGGGVIQGSAGEATLVAMLAARARAFGAAGLTVPADSISGDTDGGGGGRGVSGGGGDSDAHAERADALTARFVVYASDQTHSILQKACMILGVPSARLRLLPTRREDGYALQPAALADAIRADVAKGLVPLLVCPTVGTTSSTALDPVGEVASAALAAAAPHKPWIHVDAAYGGAYAVCPEFRHIFADVGAADSLCINAHKKLLVNFDCALMWVRDRRPLLDALSLTPEYLRNEASNMGICVDYKDWQLPLGRRFRALKLWFVMRSFGVEGLREHIRRGVRHARTFESLVAAHKDFEVVVPCEMALVCFRLVPADTLASDPRRAVGNAAAHSEWQADVNALNHRLLDALNEEASVFIIHTKLSGDVVLRLAVGGIDHSEADVRRAWDVITRTAEALLVREQ